MFDGIIKDDYILDVDIQKAYFLRDCLYEEISYELNESNVIIYKKLENGISSEITLDELIFYIHTEVVESINRRFPRHASTWTPERSFFNLFKNVDNIKKAIENMKIILKYDNESSDEDNEVLEEEVGKKKKEDNKTLAF